MKQFLILVITMFLANTASAQHKVYKVSEVNRSFAVSMTEPLSELVLADENQMRRVSENTLSLEAMEAWQSSNEEFRDVLSVNFKGSTILVIKDAPEGIGCYYYFNQAGEYLNAFCFTESGDGFWSVR